MPWHVFHTDLDLGTTAVRHACTPRGAGRTASVRRPHLEAVGSSSDQAGVSRPPQLRSTCLSHVPCTVIPSHARRTAYLRRFLNDTPLLKLRTLDLDEVGPSSAHQAGVSLELCTHPHETKHGVHIDRNSPAHSTRNAPRAALGCYIVLWGA